MHDIVEGFAMDSFETVAMDLGFCISIHPTPGQSLVELLLA